VKGRSYDSCKKSAIGVAKCPPLHLAVRSSSADIEIVRLFFEHGADVNGEDKHPGILGPEKKTPLSIAKKKEIKGLLQQCGGKK
jgi:hypothetical protein